MKLLVAGIVLLISSHSFGATLVCADESGENVVRLSHVEFPESADTRVLLVKIDGERIYRQYPENALTPVEFSESEEPELQNYTMRISQDGSTVQLSAADNVVRILRCDEVTAE